MGVTLRRVYRTIRATQMKCLADIRGFSWRRLDSRRQKPVLLLIISICLSLAGCTTWVAPEHGDDSALRGRALSETVTDVRLSAAVLSAEDSKKLFGADLNARKIQPVWIEIENAGPDMLWLLRAGTDPDYFSPLEAAWPFHSFMGGRKNTAIDEHFDALDFPNPIPPFTTRSGVIFTNPHEQTRMLNVDLLGPGRIVPFTLFLPDPDNPPDEAAIRTMSRFSETVRLDIHTSAALRQKLQSSPCCTREREPDKAGDPLNLVLIGDFENVAAALIRRGYRINRNEFDDVQTLYRRQPDFVLRKSNQENAPVHWIRLWQAPFKYRGQPVWLGQTGRPVGGRFLPDKDRPIKLHADVDEARNLLIQDLIYSGGLASLGFVSGSGKYKAVHSDKSDLSDEYHTDGIRAVMFFAARPRSLSDFEILDWVPAIETREAEATRGQTDVLSH